MPPTTTCFEMSTSFVERFLDTVDGSGASHRALILDENAALAIGESRLEKVFGILKRHREKGMNDDRDEAAVSEAYAAWDME